MALVNDREVEAISFSRTEDPDLGIVNAVCSDEVARIRDFLSSTRWNHVSRYAKGTLSRTSGNGELHRFNYLPDPDFPDIAHLPPSVRISYFQDHNDVSIPVFERLMLRLLEYLIETARENREAVITEPWWPEFTADVEELGHRVRKTGSM